MGNAFGGDRVRAEFHPRWRKVIPFGLADRPHRGLAPFTVHAVEEQHAVEVIGLEDESYRRWLEQRDTAPANWRRDEAFSQVVYLTPDEMAGMAEVIRALLAQYRHREVRPAARPPEAAPVAVVARLFPLLEPGGAPRPGPPR
jgi:hypothetical protein